MIALFDIDHTLSDAFWRDEMIGVESWDDYHAAAKDDAPVKAVIKMVRALAALDVRVVGFTARPEKFRGMTLRWLVENDIPLEGVLMRPDDDFRSAVDLKLALAAELAGGEIKDQILLVVDDREDVVAAFQSLGVTALQVFARS